MAPCAASCAARLCHVALPPMMPRCNANVGHVALPAVPAAPAPTGPEALPMVPRGRLHAAAQRHRALHRRIVPLIARLSRSSARTAQLYITLYRDVIHSTRCSRAIYICRCHSLRPLAGTAVGYRAELAASWRGPHRRRAADPHDRALAAAHPRPYRSNAHRASCSPRMVRQCPPSEYALSTPWAPPTLACPLSPLEYAVSTCAARVLFA